MKKTGMICVLTVTLFIVCAAALVFAQTNQAPSDDKGAAAGQTAVKVEAPQSPRELSIYGEVQAVNETASSMTVQYYDYDSDEEKSADVVVGKDTRMENASAIADIKKGDWVDVTYTIGEGKNLAKSVIVEKEDAAPETSTGVVQGKTPDAAAAPAEE